MSDTAPTCDYGALTDARCGAPATHYSIDEDGARVHWCAAHSCELDTPLPKERIHVA